VILSRERADSTWSSPSFPYPKARYQAQCVQQLALSAPKGNSDVFDLEHFALRSLVMRVLTAKI
jgi:hypothetical protein